MKIRKSMRNLELKRRHCSIWMMFFLLCLLFHAGQTLAQDTIPMASGVSHPTTIYKTRALFGGTITNSGVGGFAIKFSRFNNQFAFMTGGRGACTINSRYTLGGAGYGIANSIQLSSPHADTTQIFKMGYGGLELGYIFFSGKKVNIGTLLLVAVGAAFWQNKPKSSGEKLVDDDFHIFPVLEQSIYGELSLNHIMRLHAGISYRYVKGTDLGYINDQSIRGFSCFLALLFGKT